MSDLHYVQGSTYPPLKDGLLRMYNMKFCPFAERTLLVLRAKQIDFDLVNINLKKKPDWFLARSENEKVPTLEQDGRTMCESLATSDFLDEAYPNPPLYPSDPWTKGKEKTLIEFLASKVITPFNSFYSCKDEDLRRENLKKLCEGLKFYEDVLTQKGSLFFSGEEPGMLDYMLWPWIERLPMIEKIFEKENLTFRGRCPVMMKYADRMEEKPAVSSTAFSGEVHVKYLLSMFRGGIPDYDMEIPLKS